MTSILLDYSSGVDHPLNDGFTIGLVARRDALIALARQVRETELAELEERERSTWVAFPYPFVYGAFSWFATSLTAYLQLVPLADRLRGNPSLLHTLTRDRKTVKALGQDFVDKLCPEIRDWRNQVGAHAALADPRRDDNLALLLASVSYTVSAKSGRFFVGIGGHAIIASGSSEPIAMHTWKAWSITETFDRLSPRFWPDHRLDDLAGSADSPSNI